MTRWPRFRTGRKCATLYVHRPLQGGDGKALSKLLDWFRPAGPDDRNLSRRSLLTLVWGGKPGRVRLVVHLRDPNQCEQGPRHRQKYGGASRRPSGRWPRRAGQEGQARRDRYPPPLRSGVVKARCPAGQRQGSPLSWTSLKGSSHRRSSPVINVCREGQCPKLSRLDDPRSRRGVVKDLSQRCVPVWLARPETYSRAGVTRWKRSSTSADGGTSAI